MTDVAFASRRPSTQSGYTGAPLKDFHDASKTTTLICHAPAALAAAPRINDNRIYDTYRMIRVDLLADQLTENIPFFDNGGHNPDPSKPILECNRGRVNNTMLSKSYVVEDREPVTTQDLFSGKEMGALLLRKIETIVNS